MNFYILISRRYQTWHVPSAFFFLFLRLCPRITPTACRGSLMSDAFVSQLSPWSDRGLQRVNHESHLTFVRIWQDVPDNYVESEASELDVSQAIRN